MQVNQRASLERASSDPVVRRPTRPSGAGTSNHVPLSSSHGHTWRVSSQISGEVPPAKVQIDPDQALQTARGLSRVLTGIDPRPLLVFERLRDLGRAADQSVSELEAEA